MREYAARALGRIGDARAVELLAAVADDKDASVHQEAVAALTRVGDVRAAQPLIGRLRDGDRSVREKAAEALGHIDDARATDALVAALRDEDYNVLFAVADALGRLGWRPTADEAGAWYWFANGQPGRCAEVGAGAVGPLIAMLRPAEPLDRRRGAATALVALYQSGNLSSEQKAQILRERSTIARPHSDFPEHCSFSHEDRGIGVEFPL